jgi:hypothetical protein
MAYPSGAIEKNPPGWEYRTIAGAGRFEVDLEMNRAAREEGLGGDRHQHQDDAEEVLEAPGHLDDVLMRRHRQGWRG